MRQKILDIWQETINDTIKENSVDGVSKGSFESVQWKTIGKLSERIKKAEFVNEHGEYLKLVLEAYLVKMSSSLIYGHDY